MKKRTKTQRREAPALSAAAEARSARELAAALNRAPDGPAAAPSPEPAAPPPRVAITTPLRDRVRAGEGIAELLLFRVGGEHFAADLPAIEEAIEIVEMRTLPEMPREMLGLVRVRGRMTPLYSPARALGVPARAAAVALLVRGRDRRVGLAVDDVDDVLRIDLSGLADLPAGDDEVLLGMTRHGKNVVAILDVLALVTACLSAQAMENG
jgi:purine-binding chemotaxis protein CheW